MDQRLIEMLLAPECWVCGIDMDSTEDERCLSDSGLHEELLTASDVEWRICGPCHGDGYLAGWPGVYTESDRAEWSEEDYDDYRETRRCCEDCGGSGKVRAITRQALARPEVRDAIYEWQDTEAIYRAERAMGA